MKKLKHSKYKNTGILFEMLVRKLTSETLSSNKSVTVDIIKKYFGKNTELSKELQLYNALLKEQFKSEAQALDYIRTVKSTHDKLSQSVLKRQRYNLVKEISERFNFDDISKIHINNYKTLASIYMIFEYQETDNPKQLLECKNVILENAILSSKPKHVEKDVVIESFESQPKEVRLLAYKMLVDKFNEKYSALKEYVEVIIPSIKKELFNQAKTITDKATQIKVQKLSEMLCTVENMKTIKESHVLSLLRYFDLIRELKEIHK